MCCWERELQIKLGVGTLLHYMMRAGSLSQETGSEKDDASYIICQDTKSIGKTNHFNDSSAPINCNNEPAGT